MPIYLSEEALTYQVEDTTFTYERLRYDDREKITYLSVQRGQLNQALYDKICVTVALKRWDNLAGRNGLITWPFRLPEGADHPLTPEQQQALVTLFPSLAVEMREQLNGTFYVVDHLPLHLMLELVTRVNELAPESLRKNSMPPSVESSASPADGQAMSLPALTAGVNGLMIDSRSPVTPEG